MAELKCMSWERTEDLMFLAKGVEKSVTKSVGYLSPKCPPLGHVMKPTFVTEPVINDSIKIINSLFKTAYTMLVVDVSGYDVRLYMIHIRGCREIDMELVGEKDASKAFKYANSAEKFFGCIADECFKFVKGHVINDRLIGGRTLLCTLIFRTDLTFSSIRDSKVDKFLRNFKIEGCSGQDVKKILNEQFIIHQRMAMFRIICTNVVNKSIATLTGLCVHQKMPDVYVLSNFSANFCFFEDRHDLSGYVDQKMIIEGQINNFGGSVGSDDNILLRRFLIESDFKYNHVHMDESQLMDKITSRYWMCSAIRKFIIQISPDLVKQFKWLKDTKSIAVTDISNFLQYNEEKMKLQSKLLSICSFLNQEQINDLASLCKKLTNRSAKMMAAFTWGIIRSKGLDVKKGKIVVALDGAVFSEMQGYKALFKETLDDLIKLDGKEGLQVEYIETTAQTMDFGITAINRHLGHNVKGWTLCHIENRE